MGLSKSKRIVVIILILLYGVIGILTIASAFLINDKTNKFCGILVIAYSIIHIVLYFLSEGYKYKDRSFLLSLGLISLSLGIVFVFTKTMDISQICLFWGILDIVEAAIEIKIAIPQIIKKDKIAIIEFVTSLMNLVLGILLCLHLNEGIQLHVIFLGVSFVITSVKYLLIAILTRKNVLNSRNNGV